MEKQLLTNLLQNDVGITDRNLTLNSPVSCRQVLYVFVDFGNVTVLQSLTTFLSILIKSADHSQTVVHLMPQDHSISLGVFAAYWSIIRRRVEMNMAITLCSAYAYRLIYSDVSCCSHCLIKAK